MSNHKSTHPNIHASKHPSTHASVSPGFWKGKRVLITGHTGFKGSWLVMYLNLLGAKIYGYALKPPTKPSLFEDNNLKKLLVKNIIADIRDYEKIKQAIKSVKPDVVIHMAAQPLVRDSYVIPRETYEINVMGTVNILESLRNYPVARVFLNVTTDKVYENKETLEGYKETDPLGGYDPYSSSKACSELVTSAYRLSFFSSTPPHHYTSTHPHIHTSIHPRFHTSMPLISTARAGNVIGGGDWAKDRLIPDMLRAFLKNGKVLIRNPYSIRPWQHVLESLTGYLILCQKMYEKGKKYTGSWNFGPDETDLKTVEWIVKRLCQKIKPNKGYKISKGKHPHEAKLLVLNPEKAKKELGWHSKWNLEQALDKISEWFNEYRKNKNLLKLCEKQIIDYIEK